jgi:hypothetical protein
MKNEEVTGGLVSPGRDAAPSTHPPAADAGGEHVPTDRRRGLAAP